MEDMIIEETKTLKDGLGKVRLKKIIHGSSLSKIGCLDIVLIAWISYKNWWFES